MKKYLIGIDLGGTKLAIGLVSLEGKLIDEVVTYQHVEKCCDAIVEDMAVFTNALLDKNGVTLKDVLGLGVVFPGHIRSGEGVCITTSNLSAGFEGYPLKNKLEERFDGIHIFVDNDANAQAYAEFVYGAGRGSTDMIFVTISTGVGAGIIIDKKLYRGITGTAGEIGHTVVDAHSKRRCTCGNHGCLMTSSCGMFLPVMAKEHLLKGVKSTQGVTVENCHETVTGQSVKVGLTNGDPLSEAIMKESAETIGLALYNLHQLYNPEIFVLGGGLMNWGQPYLNAIKKTFHQMADRTLFDPVDIVVSAIGSDAGILGASSLPMEVSGCAGGGIGL